MPKKLLFPIGVCLIASITLYIMLRRPAHAQTAQQPWVAYTVFQTHRSTSLPAGQATERFRIEAQRSDGSRVFADADVQAISMFGGVREVRLVSERRILIDDRLKLTSTSHLSVRKYSQPQATCSYSKTAPRVQPSLLGTEYVLGYQAVVIQTVLSDRGMTFIHKNWEVPSLDCAVVRVYEERRNAAGDLTGTFEVIPTAIQTGPPTDALFQIPSNYTEGPPSAMYSANAQSRNTSMPDELAASLKDRDQKYYANRP
jgi:uncharacterized protein involved in type VI secretion and phage assembly